MLIRAYLSLVIGIDTLLYHGVTFADTLDFIQLLTRSLFTFPQRDSLEIFLVPDARDQTVINITVEWWSIFRRTGVVTILSLPV